MAQINKPTDYFNTKLYTGNGSTQSITGVGFQPDWTWIKTRSTSRNHQLFDSVRGATVQLFSNLNNAEQTNANSLTSFDSDGFSVGNINGINGSGETHVAWNWLASNTTASNTDGSITSTVSANTTSGFSIVTYTGTGVNATIGHGLNSNPGLVIVKRRTGGTNGWVTWHNALTGLQYLLLDQSGTGGSSSAIWNSTTPTSSVFSVGNHVAMNASGSTYVAYCFADKKGFSKFGSYTGNANADGPFIYTGFKPAFVIIKRATGGAGNWGIWDTKRNTFNVSNSIQRADTNDAQVTLSPNNDIDILSNGFKVRSTTGLLNISGDDYIYMCFAESPLVGTNNIPATAR